MHNCIVCINGILILLTVLSSLRGTYIVSPVHGEFTKILGILGDLVGICRLVAFYGQRHCEFLNKSFYNSDNLLFVSVAFHNYFTIQYKVC